MRKIWIIGVTAASLFGTGFLGSRAEAMTIPAHVGLQATLDESAVVQDVHYNCRRVWRCGYYGCGWRQSCSWSSGPRWGYRDWNDDERPRWRHGWRHRDWGYRNSY